MGLARTIAVKASGAVGATGNSADYTNRDATGITVVVKNTAGSGTSPTVTVKLQEYYAGAGYVDVAGATTAAIAGGTPGTTQFTVYPGMTVGSNSGVSRPLGKTWRIVWTIGGSATPTVTFSVDATLHP
jgi:hypothetical protein